MTDARVDPAAAFDEWIAGCSASDLEDIADIFAAGYAAAARHPRSGDGASGDDRQASHLRECRRKIVEAITDADPTLLPVFNLALEHLDLLAGRSELLTAQPPAAGPAEGRNA